MSAVIKLWKGDCLVRLAELEPDSIGACVSDPPYDLDSGSGGFMGRDWDATGIAFDPAFWSLVFELLRPGGIVKVLGGARTFHRVCRAMERVGFQDVRLTPWIYGCLDSSSEVLTRDGWKFGLEVCQGEEVLCWDPDTEALLLMPVEEKFLAAFEGEMVRFANDNTDQLLTPNHRVYKKHRIRQMRDGVRRAFFEDRWNVMEAAEINRWNTFNLPLAGYHEGMGLEGGVHYAELLGWVWTEGSFDPVGNGVRIYQSTRVDGTGHEYVDMINSLVARLVPGHKRYTRERRYRGRSYVEHTWFFTGDMAERMRRDLPHKHPTYELLWKMTLEEKAVFLGAALCGDGTESEKQFYQKDPGDREWFQTLAHTMGWQGRINDNKNCVSLHENPQTQLVCRHLRKHSREFYEGDVWCVRVPTGAFMARRNGKIFITGNSGFPKSLDISKRIDKQAGVEREIVGYKRGVGGENMNDLVHGREVRQTTDEGGKGIGAYGTGAKQVGVDVPITAPTTELAKLWHGYGTALKPAWEPAICARKPE